MGGDAGELGRNFPMIMSSAMDTPVSDGGHRRRRRLEEEADLKLMGSPNDFESLQREIENMVLGEQRDRDDIEVVDDDMDATARTTTTLAKVTTLSSADGTLKLVRSRGGRMASTSGVSVSTPTLSTTHDQRSTDSEVVDASAT